MKIDGRILVAAFAASLLIACSSSGGDGSSGKSDVTFSATITAIELSRTADQQELPVTGLPVVGGVISVSASD